MDIRTVARMGGKATLKKYGSEHFRRLAIDREEKKRIERTRKAIRKANEKI